MTNYTLKNVSEKDLKNYELSVTNSLPKAPKIPLPPFVTGGDSSDLTEGYESTHTDYEAFMREVILKLQRIQFDGQKNRLYKITILVGSFDESEIPLLENAPFIVTGTPLLSTEKLIAGGVIRVTAGLT